MAGFGSIRQSLFDPKAISSDHLLNVLDGVGGKRGQQQQGTNDRAILCGIVAAFGHDKKLWRKQDCHVDFIKALVALLMADNEHSLIDSQTEKLCSSLLISFLQAAPPDRVDEFVNTVIEVLLERKPEGAIRIGQPWSKSLFNMVDDQRYALVLEAACKAMFAAPHQVAPLSLFGSLVESVNTSSSSDTHRIAQGVLSTLTLCTEQMGKNLASAQIEDNDENVLYKQLAPLLLLRRIPSGVYQLVWKKELESCTDLQEVLTQLVTQLVSIMTLHSCVTSKGGISQSEKELASQIAGLCLPFTLDEAPYSAFSVIVRPAFTNLATALVRRQELPYRAANTALFNACCQVPLGDESALFAVASFCLWLLQPKHMEQNKDSEEYKISAYEEGLASCQAGCIEFFAVCLKTERAHKIATGLQQILCKEPVKWLDLSCYGKATVISMTPQELQSPMVKTCVWNAHLLVSQRTTQNTLTKWAHSTAPWVLDWLNQNHNQSDMMIVAALQIIFVLITRCKSIDCLGGDGGEPQQLKRINTCIMRNLQSDHETTRLASLKLLLSLFAWNVDAYQGLGKDAEDTLAMVGAVAERDADFRELAKHLLGS